MTPASRLAVAAALLVIGTGSSTRADGPPRLGIDRPLRADAVVDLATDDGARLVQATWKTAGAAIVNAENRAVGADLRPSGATVAARDIAPKAGMREFDDGAWTRIAPPALRERRTNGRLAFQWYRTAITLPARVGEVGVMGATVVVEVVADDYSEVWVDGQLPRDIGRGGAGVASGFNAPNRVVMTMDARPGATHTIAILAANAPLSDPPTNFVWLRSVTLDVYRPQTRPSEGTITRLSPSLDGAIAPAARIERVATGFEFTEGPVWSREGSLLFSDPNANTIYRWSPSAGVQVFRTKSGYAGADIARYKQPGSNGLAYDSDGRLTVAEHGNRRVTRTEPTGAITVLADRFEGKRLNSPNDLVYGPGGALYFTDPPFGLPAVFADPEKELPFSGVYRAKDGVLTLLVRELSGPNGLAFSPDQRVLYVGNWDEKAKVVMRYPVRPDGTLDAGAVFADFTADPGEDAIDGIKVDVAGHVYVSAPGGVWILSPAGERLGLLKAAEHPHNMAWGDDGQTLYLTGQTSVYRVRVNVMGTTGTRH